MYIIDICELFVEGSDIFVCFYDQDVTFRFNSDDLPDGLDGVMISSIDNPFYNTQTGIPLTFNVSSDDMEDFEVFKEEYSSYIVTV